MKPIVDIAPGPVAVAVLGIRPATAQPASQLPLPGATAATQAVGPREQALLDRKQRERARVTITDADLAHARHVDACASCQSHEDTVTRLEAELQRVREARELWVVNVHKLQRLIQAGRDGDRAPLTVDEIDTALSRISAASAKKWRG
ncbi:hypothetical protein [Kitasatospora indigofera]|uniref:hypothetical protein n=1 Tax=Kitasatospora indigofera TaxID=67307 RepID=UPI0036BB1CF5